MIKHRHTYKICCRLGVHGCIDLGRDVTAVEGYVMVNFEVASCCIFRDNREKIPDTEVGGGACGINTICSRSEVADDVISGYNVETFRATILP